MGFAPTWLRQVSPPPALHDHFNHWTRVDLYKTPRRVCITSQCMTRCSEATSQSEATTDLRRTSRGRNGGS